MNAARALVDEQALDEGLWFSAETASEAYLQQRLRELHDAVEHGDDGRFLSGDAERIIELQWALHDLCDAFQQVYEAEYGPAPAGENGVYHHARSLLGEPT